jgi:hypothetical protein
MVSFWTYRISETIEIFYKKDRRGDALDNDHSPRAVAASQLRPSKKWLGLSEAVSPQKRAARHGMVPSEGRRVGFLAGNPKEVGEATKPYGEALITA